MPESRFYDCLARLDCRHRSGGSGQILRPITVSELIYGYNLPGGVHVPGLNEVMQIPGLTNAWTMPIKTRIDMLSTGIKTPVGIKVLGPDSRDACQSSPSASPRSCARRTGRARTR